MSSLLMQEEVVAVRKLRPYFHSHQILVQTDQPLGLILRKKVGSSRSIQWRIELMEFSIDYAARTTIKRQALADFIMEMTGRPDTPYPQQSMEGAWTLMTDGSSIGSDTSWIRSHPS
ncbi:hypothetical protein CDL15_Pgr010789 [Punica granatum]|uniref:Reverse transcriptase RNase H-like domain-containing protein n=1 Tax=Punica granatum TaxID=22663 RepID=A0A218W6I8_PUNGR|nr:hypothetical protein CDL15_Pgr010789 [Punica granatum]